jgi:Zn-dependent protease
MANIVQAVLYAGIWHALRYTFPAALGVGVRGFLILGIMVNLSLALFNLLPIFPLDGSHVAKNLLPRRQAYRFSVFSERYGALLLFGLLFVGYVSHVSPLSLLIGIPRNWLASLLLRGI